MSTFVYDNANANVSYSVTCYNMQSVTSNAVAEAIAPINNRTRMIFSYYSNTREIQVSNVSMYSCGLIVGVCGGLGGYAVYFLIDDGTVSQTNIIYGSRITLSYNANTKILTIRNTANYYCSATVIWNGL